MEAVSVAFASDDNYAQHMAVSIASLLVNASTEICIEIFVLFEKLHHDHLNNLKSLERLHPASKVTFLNLSTLDFKEYPLHTGLHSIATYFRLKLPSLLTDLDRILYLDSDIVVKGDILDLWNLFDDKFLVLAVEEPKSLNFSRLSKLGMKTDSPYFNGGILYLNLRKMRELDFEKKAQDCIYSNRENLKYQDQDILNVISEGDWKALPLRYNSFFFVYEGIYRRDYRIYSENDIREAKTNPFIIHFNQHPKPWNDACIDPRRKEYLKYIKFTGYAGYKVNQKKSFLPILKKKYKTLLLTLNIKAPLIYKVLRFVKRRIFNGA